MMLCVSLLFTDALSVISAQVVLEEAPLINEEIPVPEFSEVATPAKLMEKEPVAAVDGVVKPFEENKLMVSGTVP